ncbi:MAG: cytidylate kinase-like family protein [Planctomycetes bacterium]|nr:cytidylate kinase-like family protein [Planctomycetota bacterium]
MSSKRIHNPEIDRIIERQMRQWEMSQSEQAKKEQHAQTATGDGHRIDYITVSRELGSGGIQIARILSEKLKWQMYDKEILDYMADDMQVQKDLLESVDERTVGWIEEWIAPIFTHKPVDQLTYYRSLAKELLVISRHGQAIILGRAGGLILPRKIGLSVRITAPFELRCERYAQEYNISAGEAKSVVEKKDRSQKAFVHDMLNQDIVDCRHYDIMINTEFIKPESAAKLIWRALDQRQQN